MIGTLVARNRALGLPPPAGVGDRGRPKWPEEKLFIQLDSLRNFNVRAKTVGPGVCIFSQEDVVLLMVARGCS